MTLVYDDGVFKPQGPVPAIKNHTVVHVVIVDENEAPKSRTAMGADLRAIRARIVATGVPLLSKEEVLDEVQGRRGGYGGVEPPG